MADEWSYSAGKRASGSTPSSKVRVYERPDRDGLYLTCAWIRLPSGRPKEQALPPKTTRDQAKKLADETALERQLEIVRGIAAGVRTQTTLGQLLDRLHDSRRAERWSEKHAQDQERGKNFWLQELGKDQVVEDLTPSRVENLAGKAANRLGWSARTEQKYLKYLASAIRWGRRKARLYDSQPLMGLELPEVRSDTRDRIYTKEEARKLLKPHPEVDFRVTLAANIACDTGRRLSAIRQLQKEEDLRMAEGRLFLRFPGETDKTGHGALVPVSRTTARLVADALERKIVQKSDHLLPAGREGYDEYNDKPVGDSALIGMLHDAEETLGIEHVPYRAFHGLKRLHVTLGFEVSGGDTVLVGDVTGNVSAELLEQTYRQQDTDRIRAQVDAVREALEGEEGDDDR